jgi:hypothetical protein
MKGTLLSKISSQEKREENSASALKGKALPPGRL